MRVINGYLPIRTGAIFSGLKRILIRNLVILFLIVLISGCRPKQPLQEIVDAKIAIQRAKEAGAEKYASKRLKGAQDYIAQALEAKRKREAQELAREAEVDAYIAESMTKRMKEEERRRAEEADKKKSLARREAERSIARARKAINESEKETKEIKAAQDKLQEARRVFKKERFKEAKKIAQEARRLTQEAELKLPEQHEVKRGETLKIIAQEVYGDSEKWILIYRANRNKIKNADIIHPGQILSIPRE